MKTTCRCVLFIPTQYIELKSSKSNPGPPKYEAEHLLTTQRFSLFVHTAAGIPTDYYVSSKCETTSFGYREMRQTGPPPSVHYGLPTSLRPTSSVTRIFFFFFFFFLPNRSQIPHQPKPHLSNEIKTQRSLWMLQFTLQKVREIRGSGELGARFTLHIKIRFWNVYLTRDWVKEKERDGKRHTYTHILRLTGPICSSNIYYTVSVLQSCGHFLPCNMAPTREPVLTCT